MRPTILGVDPGFAAFGWTLLTLSGRRPSVKDIGVLRTKKSNKKRRVLTVDDNLRRARELATSLRSIVKGESRLLLACEAMSFTRDASVSFKMGMTWGLLVMLAAELNVPILQVTPQELKLALTGKADASKKDVEGALVKLYPNIPKKLQGTPSGLFEHAYDSLGAAHVVANSEEVRLAAQFG